MLRRFFDFCVAILKKIFRIKGEEMSERESRRSKDDGFHVVSDKELWKYGVKVIIEDDNIVPVEGPFPEEAMSAITEEYQPNRAIMNLAFATRKDPNELEKKLDPPIIVRFWYTEDDLAFACEKNKQISMAFWENEDKKWIKFTREKHNFCLVPEVNDDYIGYGEVKLSNWDDPGISVGK